MRDNPVKQALAAGEVALGTMLFEFDTSSIGRLAAAAGAQFVVIDQEHSGWSVETVRRLVAFGRSSGIVPIVRPPATAYHLLARPLDVGALGLMVPMVGSAEQARTIVSSAKFPPVGRRGFGLVMRDDHEPEGIPATMRKADESILLIAQIESAEGVEAAEAIAAVDGIDVLWVGQYDLTASLGIPGRFDLPEYDAAVERVLAACARHGKTPAIMAGSVEEGGAAPERGFRCIAYSGDLWLYEQALRAGIDALSAAAAARPRA
jgi:2-dehydro-3-deoxyglucarate aldolase/4-hydroxy-2-oxoheptanedioate aldolase